MVHQAAQNDVPVHGELIRISRRRNKQFVVIPGSKNVDHIKDNRDILDFRLTEEEMAEIAKLDKGERYYHRTDEQLAGFAAWRPSFETK